MVIERRIVGVSENYVENDLLVILVVVPSGVTRIIDSVAVYTS